MKKLVLLLCFLLITGTCFAAPSNTISGINSFTPLTTIESAKVNANFTEVQSKYNAHSHTDITQLGTVVTGVWTGTPITTTYGGTGNDFSAVVQGSVIYFNAAGTTTTLSPGTAGYILQTNGTGANPTWVQAAGGAKDSISRGFEASGSVASVGVVINSGVLYHGTTQINIATKTILTITQANNYSSGTVVNYGTGAGWNYIGVSNTSDVKFLGRYGFPQLCDTSGNTEGTWLYHYDVTTGKYWRIIGAIKVNTSNQIQNQFYQDGNKIIYGDSYSSATLRLWDGAVSTSWVDIPGTNNVVPLYMAKSINFWILQDAGAYDYFRCKGYNDTNGIVYYGGPNGMGQDAPNISCSSDQIVQWKSAAGTTDRLEVTGYNMSIR